MKQVSGRCLHDSKGQGTSRRAAIVTLKGKQGFVNRSGQLIIPAKFDIAGNFFDGLAHVKLGDHWGVVDKKGHWVLQPKFDDILGFFEGLSAVENQWEMGFCGTERKYRDPLALQLCRILFRRPSFGDI